MMEMSESAFILLRNFIRKACGVNLSDDKKYLIHQRLEPLAIEQGCRNLDEFTKHLLGEDDGKLRTLIIGAIITSETSFFRDTHPWEVLAGEILPSLLEEAVNDGGRPVRILSAASATGQEAYSLAILIEEFIQNNQQYSRDNFEVVATDISQSNVEYCKAGVYTSYEIKRGLSVERKEKFFVNDKRKWIVNDDIRKVISFHEDNLINSKAPSGIFDLILCRNILIYFENELKDKLFGDFYRQLHSHGWLLLGSTENTYGITDMFKSRRLGKTIIYQKNI